MKSTKELRNNLRSQWLSADHREQRLSSNFDWPLSINIGKPTPQSVSKHPSKVQQHLVQWRQQKIGRVEWLSVKYQSATQPVDVPYNWLLDDPEEWILACADASIKAEYAFLSQVKKQVNPMFHQRIVRHRSLWSSVNSGQQKTIIECCQLAMSLKFGMAKGLPLRALAIEGIDSKFLENHRGLIIQLLNIRFNHALQGQSLETFLGASEKNEHWLLVKPLADNLLPFKLLRLRTSELKSIELPANNLLIIENEQCHHLLPKLENTIAILGSGLNLSWLANTSFRNKNIYYWGDIDTWGLKMLALARQHRPNLIPVLMDQRTFHQHQPLAVPEPKSTGLDYPSELTQAELALHQTLIKSENGRLEQERISPQVIELQLLDQIK